MDRLLFFENKVKFESLDEEKPYILTETYNEDVISPDNSVKISFSTIYTDGQLSRYGKEETITEYGFVYKTREIFVKDCSYIMLDSYSYLTHKHDLTFYIKKSKNLFERRKAMMNILNNNSLMIRYSNTFISRNDKQKKLSKKNR